MRLQRATLAGKFCLISSTSIHIKHLGDVRFWPLAAVPKNVRLNVRFWGVKRTFAGLSLLTDTYLQVPIWTDLRRGGTIPPRDIAEARHSGAKGDDGLLEVGFVVVIVTPSRTPWLRRC